MEEHKTCSSNVQRNYQSYFISNQFQKWGQAQGYYDFDKVRVRDFLRNSNDVCGLRNNMFEVILNECYFCVKTSI